MKKKNPKKHKNEVSNSFVNKFATELFTKFHALSEFSEIQPSIS